jgi:SAM-dependent methyltransferase
MLTLFRKVSAWLRGIVKNIPWPQLADDGRKSSEDEINYHTFFEAYKARLERFNSTDKYQYELRKLREHLGAGKILDYGCGTGYAVTYLHEYGFDVYGYDRFRYVDGSPSWYRNSFPFKFDQVYFMHSFAHVDNIEDVLYRLRPMMNNGGELIIITPNRVYLDYLIHDPSYQPDTTVVQHYDMIDLAVLLNKTNWKIVDRRYIGHDDPEERILIKAKL